jgi:GalNAc-alpha-(1->4)-GalNAc-alpha-(1->3)-diNAcBac-PP-undecaprenol alpha-1,4-N-acetyl-D-galactosaminyltransferase
MTRIALVIHSLQAGGMERVMSQLATHFAAKRDVQVHLVLYGITRDVFYPIPGNILLHRPAFTFSPSNRFGDTLRTLLFLRKTVRSIQPDSVLTFGDRWNNLVLLALLGFRHKVYASDRSRPGKDLGWFHNRLKQWLYPKAAGLILQTEHARALAAESALNRNLRVIGNPIRSIAPSGGARENIVLSVGRLVHTKHFDQLIRLFARINLPTWRLVVVGGNAQRQNLMPQLQALIAELGVGDRVLLAGNQSDVDAYYRKARIFAFTSSSEGFPNVVGEALSAELPVVSFDCVAGPAEMIADGRNGFLVPVFDYAQFEEKLRLLMEDEALRERLAANARPSVERFSVERTCEQFYEFMLAQ